MDKQNEIKWIYNCQADKLVAEKAPTAFLAPQRIAEVVQFHRSFPQYAVTPLHALNALAKTVGVKRIWVKDESFRFGLNAFKGLGGSYAIGKYLSEKLGMNMNDVTFDLLKSRAIKEKLGEITFVTATDGNHGRGVAWAASQLGHHAVVYMPKGAAPARLENIRAAGAAASITDLNYDDTVRLAKQRAEENGWVLIQDTAWDGYEEVPVWIMQGYATIISEALEQIAAGGAGWPTHVFLQAGVGSFAASMLGYLVERFGEARPLAVVVEPDKADCLYKSIAVGDGAPHAVTGALDTIMAGLACGEPSTVSWGILRDYAKLFVSCPDYVAARGMRILANPLDEDPKVVSGESGAVGLGLVSLMATQAALAAAASAIQLNQEASILIISTEGDTDPVGYRSILWDGAYPSGEQNGTRN